MSNFARLEMHEGLQVLCRVESVMTETGKMGPAVFTRCDANGMIETKERIWASDASGWGVAERFMAEKDLAAFVKSALRMNGKGGTP